MASRPESPDNAAAPANAPAGSPSISRRKLLTSAAAAAAVPYGARALAFMPGTDWPQLGQNEQQIPFTNDTQPDDLTNQIVWQQPFDWHTPADRLYDVSHYDKPTELSNWHVEITGMVERPRTLSMDDLRALPTIEYTATIECGGNGLAGRFMGAIGNMRWAGTPLVPLLESCGIHPEALEAVFFGADFGTEEIRNNEYEQHFARSLPLGRPVMDTALVCYEMNGEPLSLTHGSPVRLVVPGWFGVAWVKWLNRIDITDRRYVGRFMSRDYVTLRGEETDAGTVWHRRLVGPMRVKSIAARAIRQENGDVRIEGAAWTDGTPLESVQLSIDDGEWRGATLQPKPAGATPHTWTFWSYVWPNPPAGAHSLASRATDTRGRRQPKAEDPEIALKKTYWEANQQIVREIEI